MVYVEFSNDRKFRWFACWHVLVKSTRPIKKIGLTDFSDGFHCPWIGYAHDLYERVLQRHWRHNWDVILGVIIEERSNIRQVMRQRNSPRWEGWPRSNATQKQKLWASESPNTEDHLSLFTHHCMALFGHEKQPQLPIASISGEEAKWLVNVLIFEFYEILIINITWISKIFLYNKKNDLTTQPNTTEKTYI